jgi:hypothetical protein
MEMKKKLILSKKSVSYGTTSNDLKR